MQKKNCATTGVKKHCNLGRYTPTEVWLGPYAKEPPHRSPYPSQFLYLSEPSSIQDLAYKSIIQRHEPYLQCSIIDSCTSNKSDCIKAVNLEYNISMGLCNLRFLWYIQQKKNTCKNIIISLHRKKYSHSHKQPRQTSNTPSFSP